MHELFLNIWAANKISNYSIPVKGVWIKLIDVGHPKDFLFDELYEKSLGKFPRGIYAFPNPEYSPLQNYDEIMKNYPEEDGELPFMIDMEHENKKPKAQQDDELHELLTRIDVTLQRKSIIYTRNEWWLRSIGLTNWDFLRDFCISLYYYADPEPDVYLSVEKTKLWVNQLAGTDWVVTPSLRKARYWQIVGDKNHLPEMSGDVDLILENDQVKEKPMILYYPLPEGFPISQRFGENPQWYPESKGHNGIDWACPVGTPLYSASDGIVERADEIPSKIGYGRQVRIRTAEGILIYGHLSKLGCKVGDVLKAKQQIGLSGGATSDPCSGMSTGPHLHFEIRPNTGGVNAPGGYLGAIDPHPYLVGHSYTGEVTEALFTVKITVAQLNVRAGAGIHYADVGDVYLNQTPSVYKVDTSTGWYKIDPTLEKWISGNPSYSVKIEPQGPTVEDRLTSIEKILKDHGWM